MSGSYGSSHSRPVSSIDEVINAYSRGLPSAMGLAFNQTPEAAQTLASGVAGANPIYTASGLQQLQQFAPGYQQAGANLAQAQANTTANLLGGAGGRAALTADALDRVINPAYYSSRENLSNQTANLFNSIGGAKLSPAEMAATERAVNQGNTATGNSGQFNPYNTIANAMNFGQALRQKQALLNNVIGTAGANMPNLQNSQFNPTAFAVGAGNVAGNFGLGTFNPTQANPLATVPVNFAQSALSGMYQMGSTPYQESKDTKGGVGDCCFIFLEAYHGTLPEHVRKCRDRYYKKFPSIAKGYKRTAKFLVPLMKKSFVARWFVWHLMVKPLTEYGKFTQETRKFKPYRKFWFTVWNTIG